jgi:hypothetical protein
MRFLTIMVVAAMVVGGASSAFASDPAESELGRLIPGVALEEDELGSFYGKGEVTSTRGLEGSSFTANSDMRIRRRVDRARRTARVPATSSARDAARKAYGMRLPRISSSVNGEILSSSDFTISY